MPMPLQALCAILALLGGTAFAEPRSPHLFGQKVEWEIERDRYAAQMDSKMLDRVDAVIAALSADTGDFRDNLLAMQEAARLAAPVQKGFVVNRHTSPFDLSVFGFVSEVQQNLLVAETAALDMRFRTKAGTTAERVQRKALRRIGQCRSALAAIGRARTASKRVTGLLGAHSRLTDAVEMLGEIDVHVALTWVQCDTVGMVGTPYVRGVNCRIALVDGYPRRFLVYVPQTAQFQVGTPGPVVVMHHGTTGTGEQFLTHSGWTGKAEQVGCAIAYPTSLEYFILENGRTITKWNDFDLARMVDLAVKPAGYPPAAPWPADDLAFERAILDDLEAAQIADPSRLFACGFSSGAEFTMRLAVELSDRIDAAGCAAGGPLLLPLDAVENIPVSFLVGTRDELFLERINNPDGSPPPDPPYAEIPLDPAGLVAIPALSVAAGAHVLATFDLAPLPHSDVLDPLWTHIRWATPLAGNTAGNTCEFRVLAGLTHHFPHGAMNPAENPNSFSAPDIFWAFFAGP
ncbi:MAG: hypothetical protein MUE73_02530 [Planctomycetes bacterium]|nr:hypothetical protein [Planctomycetota bacterium]